MGRGGAPRVGRSSVEPLRLYENRLYYTQRHTVYLLSRFARLARVYSPGSAGRKVNSFMAENCRQLECARLNPNCPQSSSAQSSLRLPLPREKVGQRSQRVALRANVRARGELVIVGASSEQSSLEAHTWHRLPRPTEAATTARRPSNSFQWRA